MFRADLGPCFSDPWSHSDSGLPGHFTGGAAFLRRHVLSRRSPFFFFFIVTNM